MALVFIVGCQNEIDVGDVLDDLFDRALRNIVKGSVSYGRCVLVVSALTKTPLDIACLT
jgi:hypothetical protein